MGIWKKLLTLGSQKSASANKDGIDVRQPAPHSKANREMVYVPNTIEGFDQAISKMELSRPGIDPYEVVFIVLSTLAQEKELPVHHVAVSLKLTDRYPQIKTTAQEIGEFCIRYLNILKAFGFIDYEQEMLSFTKKGRRAYDQMVDRLDLQRQHK